MFLDGIIIQKMDFFDIQGMRQQVKILLSNLIIKHEIASIK